MDDNLAKTLVAGAEGGAATLLGLLSVALAWFALPTAERKRLRLPVLFLLLHLAALGVEHLVPANARRPWEFFGLLFVWAALAQSLPMLVIDGLLAHRLRWQLPKIFRDIIQMLVYFGVGLVVLHSIGFEPSSLLATSALLTAVIGLSLQDTLGNLFAGLAIQAQTPFEVGDWVQLAESNEPLGRVVEINWRATKLLTTDRVEIVVPNANLARSPIRNFSKPTVLLRRQIRVMVPSDFAPAHVRNLLEAAVDGTPGVLSEPKPNVIVGDFDPDGLLYVLRYFTDDAEHVHPVDGRVRERIWHALRRAGVPFARDVREVFQHNVRAEDVEHSRLSKLAERRATLRQVEVFDVLPDPSIDVLAGLVHTRRFAAGEYVLRKGDAGGEMYVVEHGEVAVVVEQASGQATEVARLGKGQFFGEMSLMTGAPRTATVRAATDLALLVVDTAAFHEV
ncbi:MAG: mechanosensitive ion channel family protein [Deltaproteobacteria bacterium]|nr:mechanosensitive ion channel family protein [Deltaproteobacteria bacterium]